MDVGIHVDVSINVDVIKDLGCRQTYFMFFPRFLYWTDVGVMPRIERSYLDGSLRQIFVDNQLGSPDHLALDYLTNRFVQLIYVYLFLYIYIYIYIFIMSSVYPTTSSICNLFLLIHQLSCSPMMHVKYTIFNNVTKVCLSMT